MAQGTDWKQAVKKAEHYKALGLENDVCLHEKDVPWEFVTEVEPGGTHRMDMDTSVRLTAEHPSGLRFRWYLELEHRKASGKGYYEIDTEGIRRALSLLPEDACAQFRRYLATAAEAVAKRGRELAVAVERQERDAATLFALAAGNP